MDLIKPGTGIRLIAGTSRSERIRDAVRRLTENHEIYREDLPRGSVSELERLFSTQADRFFALPRAGKVDDGSDCRWWALLSRDGRRVLTLMPGADCHGESGWGDTASHGATVTVYAVEKPLRYLGDFGEIRHGDDDDRSTETHYASFDHLEEAIDAAARWVAAGYPARIP